MKKFFSAVTALMCTLMILEVNTTLPVSLKAAQVSDEGISAYNLIKLDDYRYSEIISDACLLEQAGGVMHVPSNAKRLTVSAMATNKGASVVTVRVMRGGTQICQASYPADGKRHEIFTGVPVTGGDYQFIYSANGYYAEALVGIVFGY